MSEKKIYSAFISSQFESLQDERSVVISCLLDHRILPICMEHFTASASGKFADIEEFIDESDIFILLLGRHYGSCDENGVSWTEREFRYAKEKKKLLIAVICDELVELKKQDPETLSEDEEKQIKFSKEVSFARAVSEKLDLRSIIRQALMTDLSKCVGWVRDKNLEMDAEALAKWQEENKVYNLAGTWHHVHLSNDDANYIRIGNITISQDFTPDKYKELKFTGSSYDILHYDESAAAMKQNLMKKSSFSGNYTMDKEGKIFGIFTAKREYGDGTFNSQTISTGERRGIHDFRIDLSMDTTEQLFGEFHDEAPSPKMGRIFAFRSESDRNQFLLDMRGDVIKRR